MNDSRFFFEKKQIYDRASDSSASIFRNSFRTIKMLSAQDRASDTGAENISPSIPIKSGKISISGIRKKVCLDSDNRIPFVGMPSAEKKLEEIC